MADLSNDNLSHEENRGSLARDFDIPVALRKILAATILALSMTGAARGHAGEPLTVVQIEMLNATIYYGAGTCDKSWTERPGAKRISKQAALNIMDVNVAHKLFTIAADDFDKRIKEVGVYNACKEFDQAISKFETTDPPPSPLP